MQTAMDTAAMALGVGSSGSVSGLSSSSGSGSSSSSSGSSGSSSSGYGSATTTPTSGGGHYEASPTTMPMATIATVAPFYSEALTSLDAQQRQQQQHQHQHQQQQQQQQPSPGHYYHQNYGYGNSLSLDPAYNYSGSPYNAYSAGQQLSGNTYPVTGSRYEKLGPSTMPKYGGAGSSVGGSGGGGSTGLKPQATATPFYAQSLSGGGAGAGSGGYMSQSNPMYDPYKYKMPAQATAQPTMMPSSQVASNSSPYGHGLGLNPAVQKQAQMPHPQQSQTQLTQLEANYAAIKPSRSYQAMSGVAYGGTGGAGGGGSTMPGGGSGGVASNLSGATTAQYYDKYGMPMSMYSPNGGLPMYNPADLGPEPGYRKTSNNCHWGVDYNAPNCRSLPQAPAVVNSSYHHPHPGPGPGPTNTDLYYGSTKYDKYAGSGGVAPYASNPYAGPAITQSYPGRNLWAGTENPPANPRQNCCSQGYALNQQGCYYPRSNGYGSYAATGSVPQGQSQYPGGGSSAAAMKLKHPTDMYVGHPPYEATPTQLGYGYNHPQVPPGSSTSNNMSSQRYPVPPLGLGMGSMGMGIGVGMGMAMDPGSGGYYNDLNLNSLDSYVNQTMPPQQSLRSQPYPDYRKRSALVGSSSSANCYLGQGGSGGAGGITGPLTNLDAHVDNYVGYNLHATAAANLNYSVDSSKAAAVAASNAQSNNIRDFLSTWKVDDEDEAAAVLEMEPPPAIAVVAPVPNTTVNFMYESLPPTGPQATAVVDHQGMNLPDIIIDIEKANGNGIPPGTTASVDDSFGSFDVEKELDELRLKTCVVEQPVNESDALAEILRQPEAAPLIGSQPSPELPLPSPILSSNTESFGNVNQPPQPTQPAPVLDFDQNNSSNSNESTFAKEYETFIHKIEGSESEAEDTNPQDEDEYRENPKRFKFYKRKRRTTEPQESLAENKEEKEEVRPLAEVTSSLPVKVLSPKASARASQKLLAKKRRNRIKMLKILEFESPKIKYRHYFKALKLLRKRAASSRTRELRHLLVRKQLTRHREHRLPLIKRLIKKYTPRQELRNPPSLKGLTVSALNSSEFRSSLLSVTDRETVIKSVYSYKDKTEEEVSGVLNLEEQSLDTIKSLELQPSFKGFDDFENTNLSPKIKLRVEEQEQEEPVSETESPATAIPNKAEQVQAWLRNNLEDNVPSTPEPSQPVIKIILSSSSSSSSASSSSSSSSSSSTDDDSSSSTSQAGGEEVASSDTSSSSSSSSSASSPESDFNELAALERELSQSQTKPDEPKTDQSPPEMIKIEMNLEEGAEEGVSNHDIAKLKQILESDSEELASSSRLASVPKLSDLSKIALNSSLKKEAELVVVRESPSPRMSNPAARELSVEEALAEMYQQIGVASDPEDFEGKENDEEPDHNGQDVLLINLAEIFDSSSDLYVVQCDMNENILGVVANGEEEEQDGVQEMENNQPVGDLVHPEEAEQVNTLQLIQLLAEPQPEFDANTPLIHHEEIIHDEKSDPQQDRRQLLKYLHGKYVQSRISRYYHAHRILRKYKRQRAAKKPRSRRRIT
ncbi:hypothetical protein KR059_010570 [Drosophila kikkawai]|nr:hypothetical protein KR059_010570 [Drosophila kikkawai]